jgi:hypothetical protein
MLLATPNDSAVNKSHPLNRGLTSWWLPGFGGRTGYKQQDLSGQHNHGVFSGHTAWAGHDSRPGSFGSLLFDGTSDYVEPPFVPTASSPDAFTVAFWAKFNSANRAFSAAIESVTSTNERWQFRLESTGKAWIGVTRGGSLVQSEITAVTTLETWQHWLWTYNSGTILLYRNGLPITLGGSGSGIFTSTLTPLRIGGGSFATDTSYGGLLDDIRIYNRVLRASEAFILYQQSLAGYPGILHKPLRPSLFVSGGAASSVAPALMLLGVGT